MYKAVNTLLEVGYHKFVTQLARQEYAYEWPPYILRVNMENPTAQQLSAMNNSNLIEQVKEYADNRNAYMLILTKCDGHQVENLLEHCPAGHAGVAFKILAEFFNPGTTSGQQHAYVTFFTSTMASTHTTIVEWTSLVIRNAKVVRDGGGSADDNAQVAVLLKGLLPEFKAMTLYLNNTANLTMQEASKRLLDFAKAEGILELSKGGSNTAPRAKVFLTIEEKSRVPCQNWSRHKCPWGTDCHYNHDGPGAALSAEERERKRRNFKRIKDPVPTANASQPQTHIPSAQHSKQVRFEPATARCNYCQDTTHSTQSCPAVIKSEIDYTYMISGEPKQEQQAIATGCIWAVLVAIFAVVCGFVCAPYRCASYIANDDGARGYRTTILMCIFGFLVYKAVAAQPAATVSAAAYTVADSSDFEWCCDTGTNRFVTNDFNDFRPGSTQHVNTVVAVGSGTVTVKCQGTVHVQNPTTGVTIACTHVLYMPTCAKKLMPAQPFLKQGCSISLHDFNQIKLVDKHGTVVFDGKEDGGLYYYHSRTLRGHSPMRDPLVVPAADNESTSFFGLPIGKKIHSLARDFPQRLLEAHWAYGHLNFKKLRKLLGLKPGPDPDCAACTIAMSRKESLHKHVYERSIHINHRMHMDIGFTRGSSNPFQLYIDDFTRESYLDLLTDKGKTLENWVELKRLLENRNFPYKFAFVRTDSEFVYTSNAWIQHCRDEGIEHEFSAKHRHDQLGVVERAMQTVGVCFRCMMIQGGAPDQDIPDALVHANVIRNNSPTVANNHWTPKEKAAGMKLGPNKRLLRGPLFCLFYAHIYEAERNKHEPRGIACVYLGYDDRNDQYKAKEWATGKVYYTADGTFHPNTFPYRATPERRLSWVSEHDALTPRIAVSANAPAPHCVPTGPRRSLRQHGYQYSGNASIRDIPDVDISPDSNLAQYVHYIHSFGPDPDTWPEALASRFADDWIKASLEEKESFLHHDVYTLVPRSDAKGRRIYKPRPVFKIKVHPPSEANVEATLDKFKYRQTIAAFTKTMKQGIDFEEKRASTVRWEAVLTLVAIAIRHDLEISLFDVKTFFLYGELKDLVFMEQPPEWVDEQYPASDWICRLNKSMYGLPQAPHCSQLKLNKTLTHDDSFRRSTADDCVYTNGQVGDADYAACGTHVDDLPTIGTIEGIAKVRKTLKRDFEIVETANPPHITKVQFVRDRKNKWAKLHQAAYVASILVEFGQEDCKPVDTPMDPGTARAMMLLEVDKTPDPVIIKRYQKLVGMLIWLFKTRPDMMFTINLLCRFLKDATAKHLELARGRPLRYLKGTAFYGIVFAPGSGEWTLSGQGDADLAGDLKTSRSTTGHWCKVGDFGPVAFHCGLERKICTSTGQAETYSIGGLGKQVVFLRHLFADLGAPMKKPTRCDTDNQGVHLQSTKCVNHATAKHYRITQAYIRQLGDDDVVKVNKVRTEDNASDIFTKPLNSPLFIKHRYTIMGPQAPLQTVSPAARRGEVLK